MRWGVWFWGAVLVLGVPGVAGAQNEAVSAPVPGSVSVPASVPVFVFVLLAPVQGSPGVRHAYSARIGSAVGDALGDRGYEVVGDEARAEALVACGALQCIEQTLEAAGAAFGVVPAMWVRKGDRRELTLTLVGKSGRSLNAGTVINGDLRRTAADLVDELLTQRDELETDSQDDLGTDQFAIAVVEGTQARKARYAAPATTDDERERSSAHPHAWKAGPIVLLAGGATIFVAIGAAAGMKNNNQQVNKGAVAAWSVVGAAALAGGTAWWVVGEKRRKRENDGSRTTNAAIRVSPSGFDLRLRF